MRARPVYWIGSSQYTFLSPSTIHPQSFASQKTRPSLQMGPFRISTTAPVFIRVGKALSADGDRNVFKPSSKDAMTTAFMPAIKRDQLSRHASAGISHETGAGLISM